MTDNEALEHLAKLAISQGINYSWLQRFVLSTEMLQSRYAASVREANLLRSEAVELRAERDEARRIACTYVSGTYKKDVVTIDRTAAMAEAARRGWDCYEDGKKEKLNDLPN